MHISIVRSLEFLSLIHTIKHLKDRILPLIARQKNTIGHNTNPTAHKIVKEMRMAIDAEEEGESLLSASEDALNQSRVTFLPGMASQDPEKKEENKTSSNGNSLSRSAMGIALSLACGLIFSVAGMIIKWFHLRFTELLFVRSIMQVKKSK